MADFRKAGTSSTFRIILCCGLLACGVSCHSRERVRIGVIVATMEESVYSFMMRAMTERAMADGVEVLWVSAGNSEAEQRFEVEAMLAQDLDVLILQAVDSRNASDLVDAAVKARVPVVALDRLPARAPVALYVTADSRKVGQLQAELLVERLAGKGNVLILEGDVDNSVAELISGGNLSVLERYPKIRVLMKRSHRRWDPSLAKLTTEEALDQPSPLHGILANNSRMAMAAVEVLRSRGLSGAIPVVGADADLSACIAILDGELLGDVDKGPYELGLAAYDAALTIARGARVSTNYALTNGAYEVPVSLTPVKLITRENVTVEMSYRWGAVTLAD